MMAEPIREKARAKINLTLHVTGRRPDGLHMLDSLVVFADIGDVIEAEPARGLSLSIDGPFSMGLGASPDNLVLRAAEHVGGGAALRLTKVLPVASGIGGGSADAAATVRALARLHGRALPDPVSLKVLGADVPVCLASRPARMRGIGEELSPVPVLPEAWLVLVNPGVSVSTPLVFRALERPMNDRMTMPDGFGDFTGFCAWLGTQRNDLEAAARTVAPAIDEVLGALRDAPLARMSGSGATCFALYPDEGGALSAADRLRTDRPDWWVAASPMGR